MCRAALIEHLRCRRHGLRFEMSDSAPPRYIWVSLYRMNAAGVREHVCVIKLERVAGEDVADFCDRVKSKMAPDFDDFAAARLKVKMSLDEAAAPLHADEMIPIDAGVNAAGALFVIAPPAPATSVANGASVESESVRVRAL
jgi:hypothetical protein